MDKQFQIAKARAFLELHHDPRLLVLPNIWDPLGARMLEGIGYPAVATASAAVAYSLGYDDGEKIRFDTMLDTVGRIVDAVDVPVTADLERGYGSRPSDIAENVRRVLDVGAVGINLEDSTVEGGPLIGIGIQCERIRAVRAMADREGVPLVINARVDVFASEVGETRAGRIEETIRRARAYLEAGADCIYPITVGDIDTLIEIRDAIRAPINVYAAASTASMRELEAAGIARLSLGPGLIRASLTTLERVARELMNYGSYDAFTVEAMSSDDVRRYVRKD